jgi:hypothetical protein
MHARCAQEFAGAHLCHIGELNLSHSATVPPVNGAWLDTSGGISNSTGDINISDGVASLEVGRYIGSNYAWNCSNWTAAATTSGSTTYGETITRSGPLTQVCTATKPLACCTTPYEERFRGYTTQAVTGVRPGGRFEMHQLCGAQFAGSHMCHIAEYNRAHPTSPPPAGGAWIDTAGYIDSFGEITDQVAPLMVGRYAGANYAWNCSGWTSAATTSGSTTYGETITSTGGLTQVCTGTRPVACCQ